MEVEFGSKLRNSRSMNAHWMDKKATVWKGSRTGGSSDWGLRYRVSRLERGETRRRSSQTGKATMRDLARLGISGEVGDDLMKYVTISLCTLSKSIQSASQGCSGLRVSVRSNQFVLTSEREISRSRDQMDFASSAIASELQMITRCQVGWLVRRGIQYRFRAHQELS